MIACSSTRSWCYLSAAVVCLAVVGAVLGATAVKATLVVFAILAFVYLCRKASSPIAAASVSLPPSPRKEGSASSTPAKVELVAAPTVAGAKALAPAPAAAAREAAASPLVASAVTTAAASPPVLPPKKEVRMSAPISALKTPSPYSSSST